MAKDFNYFLEKRMEVFNYLLESTGIVKKKELLQPPVTEKIIEIEKTEPVQKNSDSYSGFDWFFGLREAAELRKQEIKKVDESVSVQELEKALNENCGIISFIKSDPWYERKGIFI